MLSLSAKIFLVALDKVCPTCGAGVGQFCIYQYHVVMKGTVMKDDVHMARRQ